MPGAVLSSEFVLTEHPKPILPVTCMTLRRSRFPAPLLTRIFPLWTLKTTTDSKSLFNRYTTRAVSNKLGGSRCQTQSRSGSRANHGIQYLVHATLRQMGLLHQVKDHQLATPEPPPPTNTCQNNFASTRYIFQDKVHEHQTVFIASQQQSAMVSLDIGVRITLA